MIKCIIKNPGERHGHEAEIEPSLDRLQQIVGGPTRFLQVTPVMVLVVNEEGRIYNMPFNCRIAGIPIHGPLVAAGLDYHNDSGLGDIPITMSAFRRMLK